MGKKILLILKNIYHLFSLFKFQFFKSGIYNKARPQRDKHLNLKLI